AVAAASAALEPREQRIALAERTAREAFVVEPVTARAIERARDKPAVRRPRIEATGFGQKVLTARSLELALELPGAAQQRYVVGVLVIREPDDPGEAAR